MPFIANVPNFEIFGNNTETVGNAIRNCISGRGSRRELLEIIRDHTKNLDIEQIDSSFDTIKKDLHDVLRNSTFSYNWLVNKFDEEFSPIYSNLYDSFGVYVQVLMDKGKFENVNEYSFDNKRAMWNNVKSFFCENGGECSVSERNAPDNLYNSLIYKNLITGTSEENSRFTVLIDPNYSSSTPRDLITSSSPSQGNWFFYLIEEWTVEKFRNNDNSVTKYIFRFLNIGITQDLKNRYRNHGYNLLKLYQGSKGDIQNIENILKDEFGENVRLNRFGKRTKEQFDDPEVIDRIIQRVDQITSENASLIVLDDYEEPKCISDLHDNTQPYA